MLHFGLRKATGYSDPLASKEELLFVTGVRSFTTRPVFSSDDHNADKHKMERFLHEGRCDCARGCVSTQTHGGWERIPFLQETRNHPSSFRQVT